MKNLYKALANFQQEVPIIHKDTAGYGYTYADLPKIIETITPLMKKHGLAFTQPIDGDNIRTIVIHPESGETIESNISIPQGVALKGMNDFQVLGSAITYLRRYALSSILGLVTDKDIDAQGVTKNDSKPAGKQNKQEKQWLNADSENWKALVKQVEQGKTFTIEQIKKKYNISNETITHLNNLNIF